MRLAIVGSRTVTDKDAVFKILDAFHKENNVTLIVSGGAKGADSFAEEWAKENDIPTKIFKPDWHRYGRAAGFIRNKDIIAASEEVIAFWDGISRGTKMSIDLAKKTKKKVSVKLCLIEKDTKK